LEEKKIDQFELVDDKSLLVQSGQIIPISIKGNVLEL